MKKRMRGGWMAILAAGLAACVASSTVAQTTWDGGGGADTSWGNALNWDNDILPGFDGTDSLTVTTGFGTNTALQLGDNRSISRLTFGSTLTAISLSGYTLRLANTTTTAGAGTALWNANTNDKFAATVNSNIRLEAGTSGNYTGHFREDNNSGGGTRFNGTITQGAGENWTLYFSRPSARGTFYLNNAANSFSMLQNDGADVYSEVAGAFGGAALTLKGGITGTAVADHYTTPVSNNITLAGANSTWGSQVQTRLTGALAQGASEWIYGTSASPMDATLTRLEYSSVTGSGVTTIKGATIAPSAMTQFTPGTLNLGASGGGRGVLVLSGEEGHDVPTWAEFSAARTYNQSGGTNTWRINVNPGQSGTPFTSGGFAARGADFTIPASGGGLTDQVFTRNFMLGSVATLNGERYANRAIRIETDIAYGVLVETNRYFGVAHNQEVSASTTNWKLGGPVHELAGKITGENVVIYPIGTTSGKAGMVRISNAENNLAGTSRWILGGSRDKFTTVGGASIFGPSNMGDLSNIVLIFTSDAAFGNAAEVEVASRGSSGTATAAMLLFEDANGSGNTAFSRNFNVVATSTSQGAGAWGSFAGDVRYNGTVTYAGNQTHAPIHVQSGTLTLDNATFVNNRTVATTFNKGGPGELIVDSLGLQGTQSTNSWAVYEGKLTVNTSLSGNVTIAGGATLGGTGLIGGNATTSAATAILAPGASAGRLSFEQNLNLAKGAVLKFELGSAATPGVTYDQIAVTGVLTGSTSAGDLKFEFIGLPGFQAGTPYELLTFGSASGLAYTDLAAATLPGSATLDPSYGTDGWSITGNALYVQFIPEPGSMAVMLLGAVVLLARRRRA